MALMQRDSAARPGEQGFIVLGLLVTVLVSLVIGVSIGKVLHRNRFRPLEVPIRARELRQATASVEVTYGAAVTRRVAPGESLWVRPSGPGEVVVFYAERSPKIVGYAPDSLLSRSAGAGKVRYTRSER